MATTSQAAEKVTDLLQNLKVDSRSGIGDSIGVHANCDTSSQGARVEPPIAAVAGPTNNTSLAYEAGMEAGMYYAVNGFAMPHGYYYGGFECPLGDWDDYLRQIGADGVEFQNLGIYNENTGVFFHPTGYGYGLQNPYGPYTPGNPIPDGQFYGARGYSYTGHIYPQSVPPTTPFIPSSAPLAIEPATSAGELSTDRSNCASLSGNNGPSGLRPGYMMQSSGLYGRGILPVSVPILGSQDVRMGFEHPPYFDSSKEVQQRCDISLPASVSGQGAQPVTPLMPRIPTGQLHRPPSGVAATPGTLGRASQPSARTYSGPIGSGRAAHLLGTSSLESGENVRNRITIDKGKLWGRGNGMVSGFSSSMDILNEQNRGPRTTRIRNQRMAPGAVRYVRRQGITNGSLEHVSALVNKNHFNRPDFATNYDNAKFFIIKSYSEDDIHKSIKYSVWASTVNGNKKLDAAYQEAQASSGYCPLFLFFSVNASGQFCGVAEMIGPVDFNKTLDFWLQDKWTGKFPVMWHIVKDVPNHQFRHVILENNENKPVTNSRDTQEVRFDQGLEMLNIFKNFVLKTSIVDDFQFYENCQKAMQEKRARQQVHMQHQQVVYRGSRVVEPQALLEAVPNMLQEGMRPVEVVEQSESCEKPKGRHVSSVPSEKCNGIVAEGVFPEKSLAQSDSKGSPQLGVAESKLTSQQTVSASIKSSGELAGKK